MFPIKVTQPSYSTARGHGAADRGQHPGVSARVLAELVDPYSLNHFMPLYSLRPAYFHLENIFTSMFLHAGWLHVLGNMLFLWVFGDNVEDILGHGKYLLFYLLCGTGGGHGAGADRPVPRAFPWWARAAPSPGVMGAYLVKFPRSRVVMIAFLLLHLHVRSAGLADAGLLVRLQLFGGVGAVTEASQGGTAFFAHIGGFLTGIVLVNTMGTRQRYWRRRGPVLVNEARDTVHARRLLPVRRGQAGAGGSAAPRRFHYEELDIDRDAGAAARCTTTRCR